MGIVRTRDDVKRPESTNIKRSGSSAAQQQHRASLILIELKVTVFGTFRYMTLSLVISAKTIVPHETFVLLWTLAPNARVMLQSRAGERVLFRPTRLRTSDVGRSQSKLFRIETVYPADGFARRA